MERFWFVTVHPEWQKLGADEKGFVNLSRRHEFHSDSDPTENVFGEATFCSHTFKTVDNVFSFRRNEELRGDVRCADKGVSIQLIAPSAERKVASATSVVATEEKIFLACNDGRVRVSDDGTEWKSIDAQTSSVNAVDVFPSGRVVLSGSDTGELRIVALPDDSVGDSSVFVLPRLHTRPVTGVVVDIASDARGRQVWSSSRDGSVRLWDVSQQACLEVHNADGPVHALARTCTGVVAACDGAFYLIDSRDKRVARQVESKRVTSVTTLTPYTVAIGTQHGVVDVYDVRKLECPLRRFATESTPVTALAGTPQGVWCGTEVGTCFFLPVDRSGAGNDDSTRMQAPMFTATGTDCESVRALCLSREGTLLSLCADEVLRCYRI
ncbi:MAG: hypothetical protein MHM6MM_003477 [Cercozoa sp. M6MM]